MTTLAATNGTKATSLEKGGLLLDKPSVFRPTANRSGARGTGFEQTRFDIGSDGAATTSGIYFEPRLGLGTRRWSYGAGFGLTSAPVGFVCFDLSASVSRLSGESDVENSQSWKGAGPVVAIRLGASVPLIGGR